MERGDKPLVQNTDVNTDEVLKKLYFELHHKRQYISLAPEEIEELDKLNAIFASNKTLREYMKSKK